MLLILYRMTSRIVAGSAYSSDVERLLSLAGIILSSLRTKLKPTTLQYLATFHYWYTLENGIHEWNVAWASLCVRRCDKFVEQSINDRKLCITDEEYYCDSDSSNEDGQVCVCILSMCAVPLKKIK